MSCPNCKCKVTYFYSTNADGYDKSRCADCGHIFFDMDEWIDDEDDYEVE